MEQDTFLKAICGAYLMVAFADTRFDQTEEGRFLATFANAPALSGVGAEALGDCYNAQVSLFGDDYVAAAETALLSIAAAKEDQDVADIIVRAARLAVVADERIMAQEEAALSKIAAALEIDANSI